MSRQKRSSVENRWEAKMLDPPKSPRKSATPRTGVATLDYELAEEMATALGRAGRNAQDSLKRLAASEDGERSREERLREAADAVYAYFIQRELCGLKRHDDVIRQLQIPRAVLVRLGAK